MPLRILHPSREGGRATSVGTSRVPDLAGKRRVKYLHLALNLWWLPLWLGYGLELQELGITAPRDVGHSPVDHRQILALGVSGGGSSWGLGGCFGTVESRTPLRGAMVMPWQAQQQRGLLSAPGEVSRSALVPGGNGDHRQ